VVGGDVTDGGGTVEVDSQGALPEVTEATAEVEAQETAAPGDTENDDTGPACLPGEGCFLDKCKENADCQSQWCVEHMGEGVCTETCVSECPTGWTCQQVQGFTDLVYICVSRFANLCRPCSSSSECESAGGVEDLCVSYGEKGSFCGGICSDSQDCPWDFVCKELTTTEGIITKQCVAETGECPCTDRSAELSLFTQCQQTNEWGSCKGKRICTAEGLSPCDAPPPSEEACNGLDDDCDGDVDEPVEISGDYVSLCDDANPCTQDECLGASGCKSEMLAGGECIDGDPCTMGDHCVGGECLGAPLSCDDKNICTDDSCDGIGGCTNQLNSATCDDGNDCTVADYCQQGECAGYQLECNCEEDQDCDAFEDGNACNGSLFCDKSKLPFNCVVDAASVVKCPPVSGSAAQCLENNCDPAAGSCSTVPIHEGFACTDENPCTVGESCADGKCSGGVSPNCNDGNPCTQDICDPQQGCVHVNINAACNDGNSCTLGDTCTEGECAGTEQKDCDDGNQCTVDSCVPSSGCKHESAAVPCDDGNACTADDICTAAGTCIGMTSVSCDDSNPCTKDTCAPAKGCTSAPAPGACSDGNQCTIGDECKNGACAAGAPMVCNDNNACTKDACDKGACIFAPAEGPCDDGNECTTVDICKNGACLGGKPLECDDDNVCTADDCDPVVGCLYGLKSLPCDDGDVCTSGDTCEAGVCEGGISLKCDDGNPCTTDSCDPKNGCVFTAANAACDDGNPCTKDDTCVKGACTGQGVLDCDDGNPCTKDSCTLLGGCQHSPAQAACSDGNACTIDDTCSEGKCVSGPIPLECNDFNVCTDDTCLPSSGCKHAANAAPCDDSNKCTVEDTCANGACIPGDPKVCPDDESTCTKAACDKDQGCIQTPTAPCCGNGVVEAPEACDDGNSTPGDGCDASCKKESTCGTLDNGADKVITVSELNACLQKLGAQFYNVQYIEVAYGHTDYLDNVCKSFGYNAYSTVNGGDLCSNAANMYPSHCGQGWLGQACWNGCGNANYGSFSCN